MSAHASGEAEAFVEKYIEGARPAPTHDEEARRARVKADEHNEGLARKELAASGIDLGRLDALARERSDDRRTRAEEHRRRAVDGSIAIDKWLTELTPVLPLDPDSMNVIIDRVTFIRSFAGAGAVTDSHIGSLDSWAKYRFERSAGATESGTGRLSFFTLWRNPRTQGVFVNVGPRVVVNAHLSVDAEWNGVASWFIGGSEARATVRARTTVMAMWDSSVQAIVSDIILGSAGATGGFFGGDDSTTLAVNQFVPGSGFFVPAESQILIETSLLTEWVITSGSVNLDASGGAFKMSVPHLILTVSGT